MSLGLLGLASVSVASEALDGGDAQNRLEPHASFRFVLADSDSRRFWETLRPPTVEDQPGSGRRRIGDEILAMDTAERRWADFIQHRVAATGVGPGLSLAEPAFGARHTFAAPAFSAGTAEDAVRRFHQEGLSVARLWQSGSTTLSLGLSPKGRPGLWFRTKI